MRIPKNDVQLAFRGNAIVRQFISSKCSGESPPQLVQDDFKGLEDLIKVVKYHDHLSHDDYEKVFEGEDPIDCGINASKVLAEQNSLSSLPVILDFVCWLDDDVNDETIGALVPRFLSCFGPEAAKPILEFVIDTKGHASAKCCIVEGIKDLSGDETSIRSEMTAQIIRGLKDPQKLSPALNSQLMMLAVELQLVETAEVIERAFSVNRIDCGMAGDWEEIRSELHVQGLGLAMPKKPLNCMLEFKRNVGIGAFSKSPLHMHGELDEEAVNNYLETACQAFTESREGKALLPDGGFAGGVWQFLELAINYIGVNVENMTAGDAEEVLLEIIPRKVSMDADDSDAKVDELVAFWKFCKRVHDLDHAASIANRIEESRNEFKEQLSNPDNFGMAKSFFMKGRQAGFDMTSQAGVNEFMVAYNQSLTPEIHRATNSGKFDPSRITVTSPNEPTKPPAMSLKNRKKLLAKRKKKKR